MNRQHDKPLQVKPVFWLFTHKMCSRTSMCQRCLTIIKLKCRWESQSMISFLIFLLAPKIPLSWPGWPQRHQTDDHSWSLGYGGSGGEEENKQNLCVKLIFAELQLSARIWQVAASILSKHGEKMRKGKKVEQNRNCRTFFSPAFPLWPRKALKTLRQNG